MADLTIYRGIAAVEVRQSQNNRSYWKVRDDTNFEWTCWEPNAAVAANNAAGTGMLMQLGVRISQARDPQYGINYSLRACSPAPMGATPTPAGAEQQVQLQPQQMPGFQPQQVPGYMPMPTQAMPAQAQMPQTQPMPQPSGPLPSGPAKTMGQGGNFSDADITRMARSTASEAATQLAVAFAPDFSDPEGNFDWQRFWLAAEAISKFITHRAHEGWVPGVEMAAPGRAESLAHEQQILAEVQALPGTVEVPVTPEYTPGQASAENAEGGDIDWGNP